MSRFERGATVPYSPGVQSKACSKGKRTRQIIWSVIQNLHAQEQVITREVLRDVTGFKLTTVDEHIKRFIEDDESLRRVKAGVFQLQPLQPPPRAVGISVEWLGGMVTVKIGEESLTATHREAHILSQQLAGFARLSQAQIAADESNADASR